VDACLGHAVENPFSREDLIKKFKKYYVFTYGIQTIDPFVSMILDKFQDLENMNELMHLMVSLPKAKVE
jgi:hypothetical protein